MMVRCFLLVGLFLLTGCTARQSAPAIHHITYRIDGTSGAAALTYSNKSGGTEQRDTLLPWILALDVATGPLYLSAQNKDPYGSVHCMITVDGTIIKESTSDGAYKVVTCSTRLP